MDVQDVRKFQEPRHHLGSVSALSQKDVHKLEECGIPDTDEIQKCLGRVWHNDLVSGQFPVDAYASFCVHRLHIKEDYFCWGAPEAKSFLLVTAAAPDRMKSVFPGRHIDLLGTFKYCFLYRVTTASVRSGADALTPK
jgi:hypothetical protein